MISSSQCGRLRLGRERAQNHKRHYLHGDERWTATSVGRRRRVRRRQQRRRRRRRHGARRQRKLCKYATKEGRRCVCACVCVCMVKRVRVCVCAVRMGRSAYRQRMMMSKVSLTFFFWFFPPKARLYLAYLHTPDVALLSYTHTHCMKRHAFNYCVSERIFDTKNHISISLLVFLLAYTVHTLCNPLYTVSKTKQNKTLKLGLSLINNNLSINISQVLQKVLLTSCY